MVELINLKLMGKTIQENALLFLFYVSFNLQRYIKINLTDQLRHFNIEITRWFSIVIICWWTKWWLGRVQYMNKSWGHQHMITQEIQCVISFHAYNNKKSSNMHTAYQSYLQFTRPYILHLQRHIPEIKRCRLCRKVLIISQLLFALYKNRLGTRGE